MLKLFKTQKQGSVKDNCDIPTTVQNQLVSFLTEVFPSLVGDDQLSPESEAQIKEHFKQALLSACEQTQQEISLDVVHKRLVTKKYDDMIFSDAPQISPEIAFLIENDNRSFAQYLFTFCNNKSILDFWLTKGGISIPKDGLALAIRLRANSCTFERLEQEGRFTGISPQDREILLQHTSAYLKSKPECMTFIEKALNRHADTPRVGLS